MPLQVISPELGSMSVPMISPMMRLGKACMVTLQFCQPFIDGYDPRNILRHVSGTFGMR